MAHEWCQSSGGPGSEFIPFCHLPCSLTLAQVFSDCARVAFGTIPTPASCSGLHFSVTGIVQVLCSSSDLPPSPFKVLISNGRFRQLYRVLEVFVIYFFSTEVSV